MTGKRSMIVLICGFLLMTSALAAVSVFGQDAEPQQKATVQYKLVPIPLVVSRAQLQSILTAQGNAGWRYHSAFAVGTAPIPTEQVLLFSKP